MSDIYEDYKNNGLELVQTCGCSPEQYDVFKDGKQIAYIRLRWDVLRVDVPDCGEETIMSKDFGDGWSGCFKDNETRYHWLYGICALILANIGE